MIRLLLCLWVQASQIKVKSNFNTTAKTIDKPVSFQCSSKATKTWKVLILISQSTTKLPASLIRGEDLWQRSKTSRKLYKIWTKQKVCLQHHSRNMIISKNCKTRDSIRWKIMIQLLSLKVMNSKIRDLILLILVSKWAELNPNTWTRSASLKTPEACLSRLARQPANNNKFKSQKRC